MGKDSGEQCTCAFCVGHPTKTGGRSPCWMFCHWLRSVGSSLWGLDVMLISLKYCTSSLLWSMNLLCEATKPEFCCTTGCVGRMYDTSSAYRSYAHFCLFPLL